MGKKLEAPPEQSKREPSKTAAQTNLDGRVGRDIQSHVGHVADTARSEWIRIGGQRRGCAQNLKQRDRSESLQQAFASPFEGPKRAQKGA